MSARLMLVDDQQPILSFLERTLLEEGYDVVCATSATECRRQLPQANPDLILLDMLLPDGNGLEILRELRQDHPHLAVILMTAYGELDTAVEAIRAGAQDFITKPFNLEQLLLAISRALGNTETARRLYSLRRRSQFFHVSPGIVMSAAPAMEAVYETVRRLAAGGSTTVLLEGESGVGKDVLANLIHAASPRGDETFLELNCGALPEKLLESELFGHEQGAFTGAVQAKPGLLELAHKGTLFLDEIGEMSLPLQVKLLRVLEKQSFRRVGGVTDLTVDVRIISATNRRLDLMVEEGAFREDLYYRLRVVPLRIPPLRERVEDVRPLAMHFLTLFNSQIGKQIESISDEAIARLESYRWPGNIRELRNVIERAVLLSDTTTLEAEALPMATPGDQQETPLVGRLRKALSGAWPRDGIPFEELSDAVESTLIGRAMEAAGGNQSRAARLLQLNRDKMRTRLKRHGH